MKRRIVIALGVALGVTAGVVVSVSGTATSQGMGGTSAPAASVVVSGEIVAFPPDGGMEVQRIVEEVKIPQPLDTNSTITNTYVPIGMGPGAPRLEAEVVGPLGGPVDVTNSVVGLLNGTVVELTPEAMAALTGERTCVDYGVGNVTVDAGVYEFFSVAGQQTAAITLHNCGQNVDYVACFRSWLPDGGPPPSCTLGPGVANVPIHNGETWVVDGLDDHHRLRCLTCTHAGPPSGGTCLAGGTVSICTPSL